MEVIVSYPDWTERNERLLAELLDTMRNGLVPSRIDLQGLKKLGYIG